jgi:uncharacterized protein YneR
MSNKKSGETAECYFDYMAMTQGFVVSEPRGDSAPYDRITEWDGKLVRVQIKMRSNACKKQKSSYVVAVSKADGSTYTPQEIDIIAIYLKGTDNWYFIPVEETKKRIRINGAKDKFDKYKNNWGMLK